MIRTAATVPLWLIALLLWPEAAAAHDAFGDLGPFYVGLLHPLMAPEQGLLLGALALLLARQPVSHARFAFPILLLAAFAQTILHGLWPEVSVPLRATALAALALGALALWGRALPRPLLAALGLAVGAAAVLAGDPADLSRTGLLRVGGSLLGIAAFSLLVWGAADIAQARLGRIAGAVLASWLMAISAMAAVLPG